MYGFGNANKRALKSKIIENYVEDNSATKGQDADSESDTADI